MVVLTEQIEIPASYENPEHITHIQRQLEIWQIGNIFPPAPAFGAGM